MRKTLGRIVMNNACVYFINLNTNINDARWVAVPEHFSDEQKRVMAKKRFFEQKGHDNCKILKIEVY